MNALFPRPWMKGMLSWTSFWQAESSSWQRILKVPRPQQNAWHKYQETHKQYKSICCNTSTQLPQSKSMRQKKKKPFKFRQEATKHYEDARKPWEKRRFDPEHTDRCQKCGDSLHREGLRCPVAKCQCKLCKKIGHFSSMCYKKIEKSDYYQRSFWSSSPKAPIKSWICTDSILVQPIRRLIKQRFILLAVEGATTMWWSWDQIYSTMASVTNLEIKLKPHKNRTKFLRVRIDTCANVNLMPISVYKL